MAQTIIGIDPGLSGGIGALSGNTVVGAYGMPIRSYGNNGKHRVDYAKLALLLHGLSSIHQPRVYLEQVNAMPGQGVTSMFTFGGAFHGAWAVCEAQRYNVVLVPPVVWKKHFGLIGKDKKASLALARKMFPDVDLSKARHEGRAEALLIAQWGKDTNAR